MHRFSPIQNFISREEINIYGWITKCRNRKNSLITCPIWASKRHVYVKSKKVRVTRVISQGNTPPFPTRSALHVWRPLFRLEYHVYLKSRPSILQCWIWDTFPSHLIKGPRVGTDVTIHILPKSMKSQLNSLGGTHLWRIGNQRLNCARSDG